MNAEVLLRMLSSPGGEFRKPWAWHHDAAGRDEAGLHRRNGGQIHGVTHAGIIGVNDQLACIGGGAGLAVGGR